jgi:hypothetical protein
LKPKQPEEKGALLYDRLTVERLLGG